MGFIKSFVEKRPAIISGGWNFEEDTEMVYANTVFEQDAQAEWGEDVAVQLVAYNFVYESTSSSPST